MNPLQKIRTSFSTQLSLWVAGFVLATSGVVIFLLVSFSEGVIRDETIDATLQALENTALRVDNTLRQSEMTARLEGERFRVGRSRVEQLIEESGSQEQLQHLLPNAQFFVTRRDSSQLDTYITGSEGGCRLHPGYVPRDTDATQYYQRFCAGSHDESPRTAYRGGRRHYRPYERKCYRYNAPDPRTWRGGKLT